MKRYSADLHVTHETAATPDVVSCEYISITVIAANLDRAVKLISEAVGPEIWMNRRILDFAIEETGSEPTSAAEAVVEGPTRTELVKVHEQGLSTRLGKLLSRRTTK